MPEHIVPASQTLHQAHDVLVAGEPVMIELFETLIADGKRASEPSRFGVLLHYRDLKALSRQLQRGGQTGKTCSDDGNISHRD
jgi:hypothetical protein